MLDRRIDPLAERHKLKKLPLERGMIIPNVERGRVSQYPLDDMEVGDSFFAPLGRGRKIQALRTTIYTLARRKEVKITMRTIQEPQLGVRVWRIE